MTDVVNGLKRLLLCHSTSKWYGDIRHKDYEQFGKLMAKHSNDAVSIYPPIDLDGAMEQLAEQAANEDKATRQPRISGWH